MDSRQIKAFEDKLADIIKNAKTFSNISSINSPQEHNYIPISPNIALTVDASTKYEHLLDEIWRKLKCSDRFTRQTVNNRVKQIVTRLVEERSLNNITAYLTQFVKDIENYNTENFVYIALDNIEMQNIERLKIGSVYLVNMTDRRIKTIAQKLKKVIDQTLHTPEEKPLILQNQLHYHIEPLRGKICIEFRCVAEPDLAEEYAHEAALNVIDLLRYAIPSLYSSLYPAHWYPSSLREEQKKKMKEKKKEYRTRTRIGIGLQGEVSVGIDSVIILSADNTEFNLNSHFIGMRPLTISPQNISIMKKIGVFKLAKLLQKDKKNITSFEDVLLRSIHWFANAQIQFEIENELLNLVTSLETILTDTTNPLTDAVSYGIAFMLGTDVDKREELMVRYRQIYDERSSTSHHGMRTADEIDLIELRYIAQNVISLSIQNLNKWREHKQLLDWIKRKKIQ